MSKEAEIAEALKRLAAKFGPSVFQEATVLTVDDQEYQVDLETEEGVELFDCRLRALAGGSQSIDVLPKIGSKVVIGKMEEDEYLVIACDEIESFRVVTGNTQLKLTTDGVLIQKSTESLNKVLNSILDEMSKVYAPGVNPAALAKIKLRINDLLK